MAEKLVQLKKKGGGGGSKKNLLFAFYGTSDPMWYNEELFSKSGNTLTALQDIDATLWVCATGYGNTSQWGTAIIQYDPNHNVSTRWNYPSSCKKEHWDVHIAAGNSVTFTSTPYPQCAGFGYLTE